MEYRIPAGAWAALFLVLIAPATLGQVPTPNVSEEEARIFKLFAAQVQRYLKVQKECAASLPALKPNMKMAQISEHQLALGKKLAAARSGVPQGEIFSAEVTEQFRKIILGVFKGPKSQMARKTIRPDEPSKEVLVRLHVNDMRPDSIPSTTMPPTLLSKLPPLPKDLAYRIIGHALALKDTRAGLIVDFIPHAIP